MTLRYSAKESAGEPRGGSEGDARCTMHAVPRNAFGRLDWFAESHPDWQLIGTVESPITGQDGNVEYVMVARKRDDSKAIR